jgi:hypothetical protein
MPKQSYFLNADKTDVIELSWRGFWKDITVTHNGHVLGTFHSFSHLKQGQYFTLHEGSTLHIYYSKAYGDQGMKVTINGFPVKGSSGDPEVRLKGVMGIAIVIGALQFILGAIGEFGDVELLQEMGVSWPLMVIGAVIIGLGYCVYKFRSVAALIVIIVIIGLDALLTLAFSIEGGRMSFGGIFIKVFMIIALAKGFSAITELKDQEAIRDRDLSKKNPGW